jgi:hypothetical protein
VARLPVAVRLFASRQHAPEALPAAACSLAKVLARSAGQLLLLLCAAVACVWCVACSCWPRFS